MDTRVRARREALALFGDMWALGHVAGEEEMRGLLEVRPWRCAPLRPRRRPRFHAALPGPRGTPCSP